MNTRLAGRGALAGLLAGLLTAAYGFVFVEPSIQQAIDLESARNVGAAAEEVVTRTQQRIGFVVALVLVGAMLGLLYGIAMAAIHRSRVATWDRAVLWREAVRLSAVAFVGVSLLPALRYPANPPGVGDGSTVGLRTDGWLLAIAFALFAAALAWRVGGLLVERGTAQPWPSVAVAGLLAAALGVMFLALPANTDALVLPADLVWRFRITSFGSYVLLWGAIAVAFTLLSRQRDTN